MQLIVDRKESWPKVQVHEDLQASANSLDE